MAGRGRGRGRGGGLSINIEVFGLGRGDIITPIQAQPPPLYPPSQFKPVPLMNNDELEYRLALKQELRDLFRKSPFYVNPPKKVKDIVRYSDKYQIGVGDKVPKLTPIWDKLPHELREKRKRKRPGKIFKPNHKTARQSTENVELLLDKLEKAAPTNEDNEDADANEDDEDEETKKKVKEEDDEDDEQEDYDDEDLEEETDYNMAYFDNGEGYGDDDDDDDEGPTY